MSTSLDDILTGKQPETEQPADQPTESAPAQTSEVPSEQPKGEPKPEAPAQADAPPASEDDDETKPLPAHVVKAIRGERNDWKEKALRFEGELKVLREREQRDRQPPMPQPVHPQREMTPQEQFEAARFLDRSNMSQIIARRDYPDLDAKVDKFVEMAQRDPMLRQQMQQHPHPFEFAYQTVRQRELLDEIGQDPDAYRKKVREEIQAQIEAERSAQSNPQSAVARTTGKPLPPASLAATPSAAPRSAPTWTGQTPLEDILKRG